MEHTAFPKPSPAEPLDEKVWLDQTDRAEVGREAFFSGREREYEIFQRAASNLRSNRIGGGTLIFQGAPGAGKTALRLECMEAVKLHSKPQEPWVAALLRPGELASADSVILQIVDAVRKESLRLAQAASGDLAPKLKQLANLGGKLLAGLSQRGFSFAGFAVQGKQSVSAVSEFRSMAKLLRDFRMVIFIDEAQNIPVGSATKNVLDMLHNPIEGLALVTAFFGLSDTQDLLRDCGLSRPAADRAVNLEPLSLEDAKDSLRRMLDTYYTGTDEEKKVWAGALAELSQGWPQHINRIGVAAGRVLCANEGKLRRHLLAQALEKGIQQKNAYYRYRISAGSHRARVYQKLALAGENKPGDFADSLSYDEIESLTESARAKKGETVNDFLANALHAGLLAPENNMLDRYKIPIPSLGDYLRSLPIESLPGRDN